MVHCRLSNSGLTKICHGLPGFDRRAANVRQHDAARLLQQRMICRNVRLPFDDVEAGPEDLAVVQCCSKGVRVDDRTLRWVIHELRSHPGFIGSSRARN